jgi:hypothetical protein
MATYTSTGSGLWSAGATWVGGVKPPSAGGHKIVIASGHVVTFDEAAGTYGDDSSTGITISGTLKASRTATTALTVRGDLYVAAGGTLDYGTEADPIPAAYTAVIVLNDSASPAHNKWGLRTDETGNWAGVRLWGASKTALTTIPGGAGASDTDITVADATGWEIGDILVFDCSVAQNAEYGHRYRAITDISGNVVTIGANLGYASQAGRCVANLTRNVRINGANAATYRTHVALRVVSTFTTVDAIEIGPCEIVCTGGHSSNTYQHSGLNLNWASATLTTDVVKKIDGLVVHDVVSVSGSTVTSTASGGNGVTDYGHQAYAVTISNLLISFSTQARNGVFAYAGALMHYENPTILRCAYAFNSGYSQGAVGCTVTGGRASGMYGPMSGYGISFAVTDTVFDFMLRYTAAALSAWGSLSFLRVAFGAVLTPSNPFPLQNGAQVPATFDACTFAALPVAARTSAYLDAVTPNTFLRLRNANNDPSLQFQYDRAGEKTRDNATFHRGVAAVRCDAWYAANPQTVERTFPAAAGQTLIVVGYVRFNADFGTATPPTVTISGLGITPEVFAAPAVADAWHKFTLTVTNPQAYAGEFTITASGQSAADDTGAYFWLDGIPITDWVPSVRHYGYQFDANVHRTADAFVSETDEAAVAAYASIGTLDALHDRLYLWVCEHPGDAVFFERVGSVLDLGEHDLVVDAEAATPFAIVGTTITIKADTLLAGSVFAQVTTTGDITFANGAAAGPALIYSDASGTSVPLAVTGVRSGTKVRVTRTDTAAELAIGTAGATGFVTRLTWTADIPVRADTAYTSGLDCEDEASALGTLTATGATLSVVQTPCAIYEAAGIDGSAVTGLTLDAPNIEVDADEADNAMTVQELFAWYKYTLMSDAGIRTIFGAITAENAHKYRINASVIPLKIDQKDAVNALVLSGGMIYRDDGISVRLAGSGVIEYVVNDVYESSAAEGGLAAIKAETALIPALI